MKSEIGISEKDLHDNINLLSIILSDEMTLYIKTRKFHWNVSGSSFMELHKLFEKQYKEIEEIIDAVAERIGKLGGKPIGTMKEFTQLTRLVEWTDNYPSSQEMLHELLDDYNIIIKELRKNILQCSEKTNDVGTADFLTSIIEEHETTAWVFRRYLTDVNV